MPSVGSFRSAVAGISLFSFADYYGQLCCLARQIQISRQNLIFGLIELNWRIFLAFTSASVFRVGGAVDKSSIASPREKNSKNLLPGTNEMFRSRGKTFLLVEVVRRSMNSIKSIEGGEHSDARSTLHHFSFSFSSSFD